MGIYWVCSQIFSPTLLIFFVGVKIRGKEIKKYKKNPLVYPLPSLRNNEFPIVFSKLAQGKELSFAFPLNSTSINKLIGLVKVINRSGVAGQGCSTITSVH